MRWWLIALLVAPFAAHGQPCCGPTTAQRRQLERFLDDSGVDHLWLAGWHVDWRTGEKDRTEPGGAETKSHCSAFAAAMAERLRIYVLRPPEHRQELLANAQMRWLRDHGAEHGWRVLDTQVDAQAAANLGELVLEAFENSDPHRPGHIAIVRPSEKSLIEVDRDGPQETQAGEQNALRVTTAVGFRHHPGAWKPGGGGSLRYYAHAVDWS
jgi:hypothetical protein